ncbi:MAG: carboxypeptidase regulatory-like domain-containing protein [Terracidiphilus sp.]
MNAKSTSKTLPVLLCTWLLLLSAGTAAWAQAGRGGINGLVTDPTGAVVAGAKVTALNHTTGIAQSTVTTGGGLYSFVSLNPGSYEVTATHKGFESVAENNVTVSVDQVSTVNIALRVGSVSDTVTVSASLELLDTSNSTVGQLISAETIDRVPLLTRNVYDLVQLSAGVTPANGSPNSGDSAQLNNIASGRPGVDVSSYSINGAVLGSVYYMLDGSPLGIAENNIAAIIPMSEIPEDAIDEYRVETQNTPASYQSGAAGVISLVSKSGGDRFHGDAFGVFRPDILAANDYFNKQSQLSNVDPVTGNPAPYNTPPSFHRYQEGGAIGGPILHKKLFFFGDYEATQQELFDGSNYFSVPTTAERTGDFSADSYTIYDPTQPDVANGPLAGTRQPIAGNIINNPNPIALKYLSEFPKCNYPSLSTCEANTTTSPYGAINNLFLPGLDPTTGQKFDVRMDYYQSEKQRIFGRFSFSRTTTATFNAFGSIWDPDYALNVTNARNVLVADDLTLSPTTVLQLRYSFTRHYENQGGDPAQNGFDITSLGFPSSLAAQQVYKNLPLMNFNDVGGAIGGTCCYNTFQYASENSDAIATLTKVKGKHELSTGFEYMKRFMNVGQPPFPSGNYYFDMSATDQTTGAASPVGGNDFASFLLGIGTAPGSESTNFTKDLFVAEASPYYATFVQDTYHLTPSLTITAGLRWDIFGGKTERHNRLEYFDPKAQGSSNGDSFTGGEVFATSSNRSPFTTNLKNLGPRLGFSWQPSKDFVVHGGAGFYYGPSAQMVSGAGENSDGFSSSTNWNATDWNNDPNTIAFDGGGLGNSVLYGSSLDPNSPGGPAPSPTSPYSLSNPFPTGVVPIIGASQGLATYVGTTLSTMLHSQRTQTTYNFNFGWEYSFPHGMVLAAGYVGSRGLFLPLEAADLNQLDLGAIANNQAALINTMVPNQWAAIPNNNVGQATVPLWVSLQEFPQFGTAANCCGSGVTIHGYPGGDSEYSSLQSKLEKRLTHGFTTLASFTWAKLITDDGNPPLGFVGFHAGSPQDWKNMNFEHSVSPQEVKLQFTWQASYDLPVGGGRALDLHGLANAVAGGWTINEVTYLSDGVPIAAPVVGAPFSYFNQRTNMVCNPSVGAPHTAAQWFTPNCFATPASQFVAGTAPAYLDNVRTMGARELDLSLYKNFTLGKERGLRLEVSSYNVTNKAQFSAPTVSSPSSGYVNFGQILSDSNTPRQFQFGSKFTF